MIINTRLLPTCIACALVFALGLVAAVAALASVAKADERIITGVEQTADDAGYSVSFALNGAVETRLLRLVNPDRVAIDFIGALPAVAIVSPPDNAFVETVRHGLAANDRYRFIYRLKQDAVSSIERQEQAGGEIVTLTIGPSDGAAAAPAPLAAAAPAPLQEPPSPRRDIDADRQLTIVIDPGHGGIDNGAVSKSGTYEKEVNLAAAFSLRDALLRHPRVKVVLTRESDVFIPLDERAAIGRREQAHLFVSIHADSIRASALRGATVYTLSENASDELSRQIAANENAADRFAGAQWQGRAPDVVDILVDLTRRETVSFSEHFAASLVEDLARNDVRLIKNPKRSAGFQVLKAPDVPSVLVEMGFLSNREDEKLLTDATWRADVSEAIADAIVGFFRGEAAARAAGAD
ncbi:N-acetylmuramoyl-L-alanine amidase [Aurantimonas sp. HBX-1]|uniref:N-acetylmuramoyl-L-alanine amidase n=1 Tax=Aurantimonas sp. HBX-1 TaxID=2906072 RepID=UPI001F40200B|nr:N-acetylmuramoyl-L-alanine amidase [Aurantimonas sp. HBX-1]UIJ73665.1 N-acetylmuramoyl-L-alanine amidase [Aurantimonas sp. HBX-1]